MKDLYLNDKVQNSFFEFLNAKFKNNEIDFKQLVDEYKSIKDLNSDSCLYKLLKNEELFEELIENNRLNKENIRHLFDQITEFDELYALRMNAFLLNYIINNELFQELVDAYKNIKDLHSNPYLYGLLRDRELLNDLIKNNKLDKADTEYLLNQIDDKHGAVELAGKTVLLKYIIDKNMLSFKDLVDKIKSIYELGSLLRNKEFFEELIKDTLLNTDDLRYLLNRSDSSVEFSDLFTNTLLIKHTLNEFVLDKEIVDKFNRIIENSEYFSDWCKANSIHNVFSYIEDSHKDNEEILKLNELNKKVHNFDEDQRLKLIEILRDNEIARDNLKYIVENQLENNYDFDSLIVYLKKKEKKNVLNI